MHQDTEDQKIILKAPRKHPEVRQTCFGAFLAIDKHWLPKVQHYGLDWTPGGGASIPVMPATILGRHLQGLQELSEVWMSKTHGDHHGE